ncbi:uncharacterized protein FIESC28_09141 [Fusarium coffeatum]|uniref:BTB domain-containing protein n=1 Tax=Fusarium coffeatum TaxID=231269 RepID=A0A366R296_9HYPO|nr:uncharacterized protein FIESC28_09141 [Fusarium coffeatum]RBR11257.1 hypothetical protein FIESC28_09141 [Fusarium coffeatum]
MAAPSATDDDSLVPFDSERRSSMSNLLEEGKYSDVTITCGNDTYAVHKAIICPRSPFFATCCDGEFKEKSGVINLPDDDPLAVKMMIRFLYTGTYPNGYAPKKATAQTSATPSAPSTPAASQYLGFGVESGTFANPSATSGQDLTGFGAPRWDSVTPAARPTRVASTSSAQTQDFSPGNRRGYNNSRSRRADRRSGNQRENHTPTSASSRVRAMEASAPATPPSTRASTSAPGQDSRQRVPTFVLHANVYALGEKYEIHDLKALALQKFALDATMFYNTDSFRQGVRVAYSSTIEEDRGMRDVIVDTVLDRRFILRQSSFQCLAKETGLGFDLLMKFAQHECNN